MNFFTCLFDVFNGLLHQGGFTRTRRPANDGNAVGRGQYVPNGFGLLTAEAKFGRLLVKGL